ncbi:ABC transporter ATP-binding protein [Paenibacillus radicis (ex Gao et al. 2016)]|uniref:ABC transporter ATP-binding protein n=1 Tax=Paenibacillus radicis (ex Gao et al. 2016) TaxID=1737354 RepID=A0A917HT50_9BACL|nr:ABC transporter ATP-binding protein [Paenibacillus radicis (ex Gao et al. 2016)]GGG89186.1 ABC transporter ATP-binding protein [Paenibacillus radicis (ex Gao et al. 2016)]
MSSILKLTSVSKRYTSSRNALHNVSFDLQAGKVVGLLGSNGSGKSTIMKMAAGLLQPTSGTVSVTGIPVGTASKAVTSFMPDRPMTESWMRVKDAVLFYQDFFSDFDKVKATEMLRFMNVNEDERVGALSKGMSERLHLSLALSRNAKLYLLDEPIGGVDLVARDKILDAILQYYSEESCLVVSTHLVSDIERIFDEVVFIRNGSVVLHEEVETIRMKYGKSVEEKFKEVYAES